MGPTWEPDRPFRCRDGERTSAFGRLDDGLELLAEGFVLLASGRALDAAPRLVERAAAVHEVPAGRVDELSGDLVADGVAEGAPMVVGLGGGRVVDTAKAVADVRRVPAAAVPTTLSGAELTWVHRPAAGAPDGTPMRRPTVVLTDPDLAASQPVRELAASAGNALGHAVEGPCTTMANPVATLAAVEAARLLVGAFDGATPDRRALALGALLAGYAIDSQWYAVHHVLSQTLVREADAGHGQANTAMLPHTTQLLRERRPDVLARLDTALGGPVQDAARMLGEVAGAPSLAAIGVDEAVLAGCADAAAGRYELGTVPPAPERDVLLATYRAAFAG